MRTISINLFKFNELSDKAKQKALYDNSDINVACDWWNDTYEDAINIGLEITEHSSNKGIKGSFTIGATETADLIIKNHGSTCETYTLAVKYLTDINKSGVKEKHYDELGILEDDFLNNLLNAYADILVDEYEYLTSDIALIEAFESNEYEFTESGERFKMKTNP